MKKILLFGSMLLTAGAFSQTVIFEDNFETETFTWNLNSLGGSSDNQWGINGSYTGNANASIANTPAQPSTFTGGVNSQYLHILVYGDCYGFVPVTCNAHFNPNSITNEAVEMNFGVNTENATGVELSFWYLCAGQAGVSYGVVEYSVNNGQNWIQAGSQLSGVSTWTQLTLTNAAFDDQESVRLRFRWVNGASGANPAFSVDEIKVTGNITPETTEIVGLAVSDNNFCDNEEIAIDFTAHGTYDNGNIFTAELSDANGSFAAPVALGNIPTNTTGPMTINATLPAGTAAGTAYRIRVTSSSPVINSDDNNADLTIKTAPVVAVVSNPVNQTICQGTSITLSASGAAVYSWSPSASLSSSTGANVTGTPMATTSYTATGAAANGCVDTQSILITVEICNGLEEMSSNAAFTVFPNPATSSFSITTNNDEKLNTVTILDLNGRTIKTFTNTSGTLSVAELPAGSYFVQAAFEKHIQTQSLVIQ